MHNFNSVLLLFKSNDNSMEFCEDFVQIQSILNYANEFVKPFNRMQHKGGKFLLYLLLINIQISKQTNTIRQ